MKIDSPNAGFTPGTITLNLKEGALNSDPGSLTGSGAPSFWVNFFPNRIPKGLKLSGGSRRIDVWLTPPKPETERKENSPKDGRLGVFPNPLPIFAGSGTGGATAMATITYNGPTTFLSRISVSGINADKFTVTSPAVPAELTGNGTALILQVAFKTTDAQLYKALVTIEADGVKRPAYLLVTGRTER